MGKEILPIGSIVTVDGQDIMICAYVKKDARIDGKEYDYACCHYPQGLDANAIMIKKDAIERVKFIGFQDNRFVELKRMIGEKNE